MTKPVNTVLSDDAEDAQLVGPLLEHFIGHKIRPIHCFNGPKSTRFTAMDAGGDVLLRECGIFIIFVLQCVCVDACIVLVSIIHKLNEDIYSGSLKKFLTKVSKNRAYFFFFISDDNLI